MAKTKKLKKSRSNPLKAVNLSINIKLTDNCGKDVIHWSGTLISQGKSQEDVLKKIRKSIEGALGLGLTVPMDVDPIEQGKRDWIHDRAEQNRSGYSTTEEQ